MSGNAFYRKTENITKQVRGQATDSGDLVCIQALALRDVWTWAGPAFLGLLAHKMQVRIPLLEGGEVTMR